MIEHVHYFSYTRELMYHNVYRFHDQVVGKNLNDILVDSHLSS